jgi:cobalamin biosynthesis protein CobC
MADTSTIAHGGALAAAVKKYGGRKEDWLDLSTGINPVSAPLSQLNSSVWQALPDADLMESCLNAARHFYNVPASASLVAAPGVQSLIQLLPHLRPGKKAAIVGPTYGEYAHVFQTLGAGCRIINSIDDLQNESVVIIVNPNNPDGRIIAPSTLRKLAARLAQQDSLLIVDEAFCDLTPEVSAASHSGMRGLLVLKSFGKFFGLAGVRLGFAAGEAADIAIFERHLGPWAVSGPALVIGRTVLDDQKLRAEIAGTIQSNSKAQKALLEQLKIKVIADTGLFHLVIQTDTNAIHETLCRKHILTRVFADQPNWLRLGLCKSDAERDRLASALEACFSEL